MSRFTPEEKLVQIRESAEKRGYKCTLTLANVRMLLNATHCAYTGVEFSEEHGTHLSFERVDNERGYVPGNVIPVSTRANILKSNYSMEELQKRAKTWGQRRLGLTGSANKKIRDRLAKIENRRKQIEDLQRHIDSDLASIEDFKLELKAAEATIAQDRAEAAIYSQIVETLSTHNDLGQIYLTKWQRIVKNTRFRFAKLCL